MPVPLRWLARRALRLRFLLFQRHRHERVVVERWEGLELQLLPGVMNPVLFRTGTFLAAAVGQVGPLAGRRVLDLGTGSGIGALAAARAGARVVAGDINPLALRCARANARRNRLAGQITFYQGDLWEPLHAPRFDLILFNPPFFEGVPSPGFGLAWRAAGLPTRVAGGLRARLEPGGALLLLLSTDGTPGAWLRAMEAAGLRVEAWQVRELWNERLTIYRITEGKAA